MLIAISIGLLAQPASSQPSRSFKNEVTGQDCIQEVDGPQDAMPRYGKYYFKNTCGGSFVVTLVLANGKRTGSGGVGPGKTIHLNCEVARGECKGTSFEVR